MAQLLAEFRAARPPVPSEVFGRWVQVTNINTERFLNGRDGPDHVDSDSTGLRGGLAGSQFYWTMLVSQRPSGQVVAASTTSWMVDEESPLAFPVRSDMMFTKEYGGDSVYRYRCRLQAERLICVLDAPAPGHGVVFRRAK